MASTNIMPLAVPGMTHSTTFYANHSQTLYGSESAVYDNDMDTYYGQLNSSIGKNNETGSSNLTSDHTWTNPLTIDSVSMKSYNVLVLVRLNEEVFTSSHQTL